MRSSHPTGLHFHRRNPDPRRGSHGDCVVRAITLATGDPYDYVFQQLHRLMEGFNRSGTPNGGVPNSVSRHWMRRQGWEWYPLPAGTIFKAANMPELCIASQATHLVLVANGSIWDTWDSRGKRQKRLEGYLAPLGAGATIAEWIKTECCIA